MPKSRRNTYKNKSKNKNQNPRVFRKLGNGTFKLLQNGVRGVSNLGTGALRITGNVVRVGTGAANTVLGSASRIGTKVSGHVRKSLKRR
jgi:hypothetical protein